MFHSKNLRKEEAVDGDTITYLFMSWWFIPPKREGWGVDFYC